MPNKKHRPDFFKEWDERHVAKWAPNNHFEDRKSFPFPRDRLTDYPHLIEACQYLNGIYAQLTEKYQASVEEEEEDDEKRRRGHLHRQMKRLRRELAPQLMLAIDYIEKVWLYELPVELREVKEVKRIVQMVQKDKKIYMKYEPVFSLYLPYIKTGAFRAAETSSMDEELTRRLRLMYLRSAISNVTIRIGGLQRCFPQLKFLTPQAGLSTDQIRRTVARSMERLRNAEQEWRMIERFVQYFVQRHADEAEMLATLGAIVTIDAVQGQIRGIQRDYTRLSEVDRRLPLSLENLRI